MKNRTRKLIYLEWSDAVTNSGGWKNENEMEIWINDSEYIIITVGWIIKETRKFITLAQNNKPEDDFTEEQYSNLIKIPKTWIRKRKTLLLK